MNALRSAQSWARRIKRDVMTLWFASRHPDAPWLAKALGVFVLAYALSPIDLIPDFIPVLGYLDDVILLPVLIWCAIKLMPVEVLQQCRSKAEQFIQTQEDKPRSWIGAVVIVTVWLGLTYWSARWIWPDLVP